MRKASIISIGNEILSGQTVDTNAAYLSGKLLSIGIPVISSYTAGDDIDLIVVPGVAFDKKNIRLGRGHGYYDRFLSGLPKRTKTIGLAFDFQVLEDLPQDPHDVPVSTIITA